MKNTDWKSIAELIGIAAIVASLIFVGLQMKQTHEIALATLYQMRSDAAVEAEKTADGIVNKANEDAKKIVADAAEDATEERNRILADLRSQVAAISIAAANKLVGETLDEKRQHAIIADFFAQVPAEVAGMSGEVAEVTSALPLDDKEQDKVKKALNVANVDFKVDPNILGGLVIRIGDQIIDDSVSSQMGELRESLLG